jgi:hypothetical protein
LPSTAAFNLYLPQCIQGIILPATDQLLLCIIIGLGFLLLFVALMALLLWAWEASRHNEGLRALAFLVGLLLALAIFVVLSLMFELVQVRIARCFFCPLMS